MLKKYLFLVLFFLSEDIRAQIDKMPAGLSYALVQTYSRLQPDVFSSAVNQAGLTGIRKFSVGIYGERRFMIPEFGSYVMAMVLPLSEQCFGLNAWFSGLRNWNEMKLGLAYARKMGKVDAGIQFNYYGFRVPGYFTARALNCEASMLIQFTKSFRAGLHIYNPAGINPDKMIEKLPMVYDSGFGFDLSDLFYIGFMIEKTEDQPVNLRAGISYAVHDRVSIRCGISTAPANLYFAVCFSFSDFKLGTLSSMHQQLGITPALTLIYQPKPEE